MSRIKGSNLVAVIIVVLLWTFILASWLGGCQVRETTEFARIVSPVVEASDDNLIDVMDSQVIGYIGWHWQDRVPVTRVTDMDSCLVFYVVADQVTSVSPVTKFQTNALGKLEHCNPEAR